MHRKAVSGIMLILLLITILSARFIIPTLASPLRMSVDPPAVLSTAFVPNTQFSIDIVIDYIEEPSAYQFEMAFNPEVLHGVSVENGPFLGSAGDTVLWFPGKGFNNTIGKLSLCGAALYPNINRPTGGSEELGALAAVTFEVVGYGYSNLSLGLNSGLLNATGGWQFDGEWAWGYKWVEYLPGYPIKVPNPGFLGHGYFCNVPPVYVDPSEVRDMPVGESFTVDIYIANITDLYSWGFSMNWDATLLNATAVIEGEFLKGQPEGTSFAWEIHNEAGNLTVSCETIGAYPGVSGSGTLASVTFLVEGDGSSILHLCDSSLLDSNSNRLIHATGEGWFNNLRVHDIAITRVKPFPTIVEPGQPVTINVTVSNQGDFSEIFNVTAYYDDNLIDKQTHIPLENRTSITLTFFWDTTDVDRGKYIVSANATVVEGETDTADNTYTDGIITVTGTIYVDASNVNDPLEDGSLAHPFDKIQEGINAANAWDTVQVANGTYHENVVVNKTVSLIGEKKNTTIIDGNFLSVRSNEVTIQGFTIRSTVSIGSHEHSVFDVTLRENSIVNGGVQITAQYGNGPFGNNTIAENYISNATEGISVSVSLGNKIIGNTLRGNDVGIILRSDNNTLYDNRVESGGVGIHVDSYDNTLSNNTLRDNIYNFGFGLRGACPNNIDILNTINDRPIYFVVNQTNILVDPISYPNPGYLALINCKNATVKDFVLSGNGQGILLHGGEGNTLCNNTLVNNVVGLQVLSSDRNELRDNAISDNGIGMWLIRSSLNTIANNDLRNNSRSVLNKLSFRAQIIYGFLRYSMAWASGALNLKWDSSSNLIVGNNMTDSDVGMFFAYRSSNNTLRNNTMTDNLLNFGIEITYYFSGYMHDIDDSNTVDGKPMIYWVNEHGKQVPEDAGYVAVINSSDITVKNLDVSNNMPGILIVSSNNSLISGNRIADCPSGIIIKETVDAIPPTRFYPSTNVTVHNNTAVGCGVGISLYVGGESHTVSRNDFSDNLAGIYVYGTEHTMISGNTVTNCTYWGYDKIPHEMWWWYSPIPYVGCVGICIETSNITVVGNTIGYNDIGMAVGLRTRRGNNTIYHNNFINNQRQVYTYPGNIWDDGYPSGGNYWSDYTDVDLYSGPCQNETGSDGIWDHPYVIDGNNQDNYPLMSPYEYWCNPIPGDINKDTKVDHKDLFALAPAYGSTPEKPNWNPNADTNDDGKVNHKDLFTLAANYGKEWTYP